MMMQSNHFHRPQISGKENHNANKASSEAGGSLEGAKVHFWMRFWTHQCLYQSVLFTGVFHRLGGELNVLRAAKKKAKLHFCPIRFIFVFSVINTGCWFCASCLPFSIDNPQSNNSLAALFSQTTSHILTRFWTWSCFSFLCSLPFLSPSRWFIPPQSSSNSFVSPQLSLSWWEGNITHFS